MNCERCFYKDRCKVRKASGKHIESCDEFFPDLKTAKASGRKKQEKEAKA